MMRSIRLWGAVLALVTVPALLSACGSTSSSSSSSSSSTASAAASSGSTSSGSTSSGGKKFVVGYSLPTAQNPFLMAIYNGTDKVVRAAGGTTELRDGQLDPNKQVADLQDFINQHVSAIIMAPAQVPQAVTPILAKARKAGIPVFAWDWDFSPKAQAGGAPAPPVQGEVVADRTNVGREVADAIVAKVPHAQVLYVGLPFPVTGTDQMFNSFKTELTSKGGKLVTRVNNGKDNAEGALPLVDGALTQFPNINAVVTYNGGSAIGAYEAARAQGKKLLVFNAQSDPGSVTAQQKGQINEQWDLDPISSGVAIGKLAVAAATHQPIAVWSKSIITPSKPVTNASQATNWTTELGQAQ